ncbi:MAG: type VI secretion system contractile sheath large subunit [Myxococcales bacterium]|nr:type VI secretion system contractile sheath large subunit [Myxococcales bacterium]
MSAEITRPPTRPFGPVGPWLRAYPAEEAAAIRAGLRALAFGDAPAPTIDLATIDRRILAIDHAVAAQLDALLHHPKLQALEARWRGLALLVERVDPSAGIRVELLSATVDELALDFAEAPELPHAGLFRLVYTRALATYGGAPYGLLCGDFASGPAAADLELLRAIGRVAAAAQVPFVGNARPELLGVESFTELVDLVDVGAALDGAAGRRWRALRAATSARYLGLALPRFLLRAPYDVDADSAAPLPYREAARVECDLLWGHASIAFAIRVAEAFRRYRWCVNILGSRHCGVIEAALPGVPREYATVDLMVSRRLEGALAREGLIAAAFDRRACGLTFHAAPSLAAPLEGDEPPRRELNTQLPYVFLSGRVAHYIRRIERDTVGTWDDPRQIEAPLRAWLRRYVADLDDAHWETRSRRPFRRAELRLRRAPGGWVRARLEIEPHFTHHGAPIVLTTDGRLDPAHNPEHTDGDHPDEPPRSRG